MPLFDVAQGWQMYATQSDGPTFGADEMKKLLQFGDQELDWRCVAGQPALCLTEIRFTVQPDRGEPEAAFHHRMRDEWAPKLSRSGYPVVHHGLTFHGHGDRFWAIFHCRTPQYKLPVPREGSCEFAAVS